MKTITFCDAAIASRVLKLGRAKYDEAGAKDVLNIWHCEKHHFGEVMLCGTCDSVRLFYAPDTSCALMFASNEKPAYEMTVNVDGTIKVEFAGDASSLPELNAQVALAESLPLASNRRMPYGYVEDGVVTVIMWCSDFETSKELSYRRYLFCFDSFVLEGHRLPDELYIPFESDELWFPRFWRLVAQGKIVPLGERIKNLPGEAWMVVDTDDSSLVFDTSDGQTPRLAPTTPYLRWHITEFKRNAHFAGYEDHEDYVGQRFALREWFL